MLENDPNKSQYKGLSKEFIKEISSRVTKLQELTKASGMELPPELISTVNELSENSTGRYSQSVLSYESSYVSENSPSKFEAAMGVPPPSDLHKSDSEISISSEDSLKSPQDYQKITSKLNSKTKKLQKRIKTQVRAFKKANSSQLESCMRARSEMYCYQGELQEMKKSVMDLLDETCRTRQDLRKMREQFDSGYEETPRQEYLEFDMSSIKTTPKHAGGIAEQLRELQREITNMNLKIESSENEIKNKEEENCELKKLINRIQDNLLEDEVVFEKQEESHNCKICSMF